MAHVETEKSSDTLSLDCEKYPETKTLPLDDSGPQEQLEREDSHKRKKTGSGKQNKTKQNPCIDLFLEESNQVITFPPNLHVLNIGLEEVDETSPFSA